MNSTKLDAFFNSYELLLKSAQKMTNIILTDSGEFCNICRMIKNIAQDGAGTIHITGMGRSGKVGIIFGHMLKDIGYDVSVIGQTLAKPIQAGDLIVGFSGSGWTRTTTQNVSESIRQDALAISFTGSANSLLARMSDRTIIIPHHITKPDGQSSYRSRKITGEFASPLTPMGTIFELTALFTTFGLIGALESESYIQGFNKRTTEILTNAETSLRRFRKSPDAVNDMINLLSKNTGDVESKIGKQPSIYVVGSGINNIVASMTSMRFQHLGLVTRSPNDWRFRQESDILLGISGSGETTAVLGYFNDAKEAHMNMGVITSFQDSTAMELADTGLVLKGREYHEALSDKPITEIHQQFKPSFEFIAAITLDAVVAQIAKNFEITEDKMKDRHANIE